MHDILSPQSLLATSQWPGPFSVVTFGNIQVIWHLYHLMQRDKTQIGLRLSRTSSSCFVA